MKTNEVGMIAAFSLVLVAAAFACGSDSSKEPAVDAGKSDADAGIDAESNALVSSGTRLRAILYGPADGHKTFEHWRDTETGICQWTPDRLFADHYCLPTRRLTIYFTDASCSQAVYLNAGLELASGELIRDTNFYVGETRSYRAGPVAALPGTLYQENPAGCAEVPAQQIPVAATGVNPLTLVPLTDFVKGSLVVEERGDDRLASHVVVGEDGSRVAQDAYDIENTTGCQLAFPDAPPDCVPVAWHAYFFDFGESGRFADAACTEPVYYTPRFAAEVLATMRYGVTLKRDMVSNAPSYVVHTLGAEVTSGSLYQGQGTCSVFDTAGPSSTSVYYRFGDEITLSPVSSLREGTGPIRTVTTANSAGNALVARGRFIDTGKDEIEVRPHLFSDQVTRLAPTLNAAGIHPNMLYFEDSACTIPLANDSANASATGYVIAWNYDNPEIAIDKIYAVAGSFVGDAYSISDVDGPCEMASQSPPYFKIGAEVDMAAWALVEEVELPAP